MLHFHALFREALRTAPEAFDSEGRLLTLGAGSQRSPGRWSRATSPVDGSELAELPSLDASATAVVVEAAAGEFHAWAARPLAERVARVSAAVAELRAQRGLLSALVSWELGKTRGAADADVDRALGGVDWYLAEIGSMMSERTPLGLVSNVASWNYPFSVLLHNVLVQALTGNSVIAKSPSLGGGIGLSLAVALARRHGLPVTLVGGRGAELSDALIAHPAVAAVAFVGGRTNGGAVAERLRGSGKRYALEMEGVNAYAMSDFSNWSGLKAQIQSGFDFGKQRCTAYTRWVVQRSLLDRFVETYVAAASALQVGNPLADAPVSFGPLISAAKVNELRARIAVAKAGGATVLYEGRLAEETFLPGQSRATYLAPTLLMGVPRSAELYQREPFGPVDVVVPVDSEQELIREANVSRGALVASVATDDVARGERIAGQLHAFKVGVNRLRSRGDRAETFGGHGHSWEGAFVGGSYLIDAFSHGDRPPAGNYSRASATGAA
jgi:acyl-CoA reductase-like NAD-dependent aldehyde dehydrogenase